MGWLGRLFNKNSAGAEGEEPPEILPKRNDPCWCGSGEKYKKCHMSQDRRDLERKKERDESARKECGPVFG